MRKLKRGDVVYWWTSASYFHAVKFVRWVRMQMGCGGSDSNKIGVGAIVSSSWLFGHAIRPRIDHGCKRGQAKACPYMSLYRTERDARMQRRAIQRPQLCEVPRKRRKK